MVPQPYLAFVVPTWECTKCRVHDDGSDHTVQQQGALHGDTDDEIEEPSIATIFGTEEEVIGGFPPADPDFPDEHDDSNGKYFSVRQLDAMVNEQLRIHPCA